MAGQGAPVRSFTRPAPPERFAVNWSPVTGKGDVVERFPSGDLLRTCFHCQYAGYTGGLVIGNLNGSGMGLYPARPLIQNRCNHPVRFDLWSGDDPWIGL